MNKKTVLAILAGLVLAAGTIGHAQKPNMHVEINNPAKFDSGEESLNDSPGQEVAEEHRPLLSLPRQSQGNNRPDGALQGGSGPAVNVTPGLGFDGVPSNGYAPPDTNMAVGPNHVIQWVNVRFAIYDKSGTMLPGYPKLGNAFWSGFGGPCETQNSGDPIIQYDAVANRWIASQFTSTLSGGNYYQCFAISQTSDPTGAYNRYAYAFSDGFPDYPKISVWKNAYFASYNMFTSTSGFWIGPRICAYDRAAMLAGTNAVQQCFNPSGPYGSLLPADLDGGLPFAPPSNTGYFLDFGTNALALWRFTPDFATPANTTLVGPVSMPAAAFSTACGGGACIPQGGTTQKLDSLADRLMYRLAYRNFGDHESLVVNQSVTAGTSVGIRWYEIRNPQTTAAIFQQGTFAPDSTYRWMGSAAMDKAGNIAVGYSQSSSTSSPSIRYTGRETGDPLGTLQAEQVVITSGGSQIGGLSRWGDYAAMRIDPTDDCTFWFTSEYLPSSGSFNWRTRINSFKFNSCGTVTPDFTVSATPPSQTVTQGTGTSYTVNVGSLGGFAGPVTLSAPGLPSGVSATFSSNPVAPGSNSTMNVSTDPSTSPGTYTLTITGTNGSLSHSTTVTLVVQAVVVGDFSLSADPPSATIAARQTATYTITIARAGGFSSAVSFSVSGLPARTSASFSPSSTTLNTTTLSVKANPSARTTPPTTLTITGTGGGKTHTTTVSLAIQ